MIQLVCQLSTEEKRDVLMSSQLSPTERLGLILSGKVGVDIESGAYVRRSRGRTKLGDHHYTLVIPTCNMWLTESGMCIHEPEYRYFRAVDDREAIGKANARLDRLYRHVGKHAARVKA